MKIPIEDMTDEQFERWLKRQGLVGMGAFNASLKRRQLIEAKKDKRKEESK